MSEKQKAASSWGGPLEITETTTIKVKYAELPNIGISLPNIGISRRYLYQILEPFKWVPIEKYISIHSKMTLEESILADWKAEFERSVRPEDLDLLPDWIKKVDKVELIECDLLVPKNAKEETTIQSR